MWDWFWPALAGFVVGFGVAVTAIEKVRDLFRDFVKTTWYRWRPWRLELAVDVIDQEIVAGHIMKNDDYGTPYVLRNRGPEAGKAVHLALGGFLDMAAGNIDPNAKSTVIGVPQWLGGHRIRGRVTWQQANGSKHQRVRTPKWNPVPPLYKKKRYRVPQKKK